MFVVTAQKTLSQPDMKKLPRLKRSQEVGDSDIDAQTILNKQGPDETVTALATDVTALSTEMLRAL